MSPIMPQACSAVRNVVAVGSPYHSVFGNSIHPTATARPAALATVASRMWRRSSTEARTTAMAAIKANRNAAPEPWNTRPKAAAESTATATRARR